MAFTDASTYMNLPIPEIGVDPGPQYALDINTCLNIIDQHNHLPGLGVAIQSAALNINADVPFNSNNLTGARSIRFQAQSSPLAASGVDLNCLDVGGVDLYYNDGAGNQVRLTQNGGVAGSPGSIGGLTAPASVNYVSLNQTYVFQSAANTPGNIDAASYIFRNLAANSKGLTLSPPAAMGADYTLILPALPAQQSFMTLDQLGNITAPWTVDNSTIKIVSNQLVASGTNVPREHSWELNGPYPGLTYPLTNIDAIFFAPFNLTILSVWIYNGTAGASGTTEFDLKVASSGGSFTSILSTTGKITSAAAANIWTDSGSIIGSQTGVTKPIITTTSMTAGQALRWDLIQGMASPATDARIRIFYQQT